jgi:molybdopterin-guanine dinucleotide biosynthesis protein A
MGRPKAMLPFGDEILLRRAVRQLADVVATVVVVAAPEQALPELDRTIRLVRDRCPGRGPLEGLRVGLAAIQPDAEAAFVTGCDFPFLAPAFVHRLLDLLGQNDIAVPKDSQRYHPLAAVYRTRVIPHIDMLLARNRLRPVHLFPLVRTLEVPVEHLRDVDPELATLTNLNYPEDYGKALERAGLSPS